MDDIAQSYLTPGHPAAFSSAARLKKYHKDIKLKDIEQKLRGLDVFTLHKQFKKPKRRNPFFVLRKREHIQMDLIELKALGRFNKGYKYILLAIDIFTKKVKLHPLKTKRTPEILAGIQSVLNHFGEYPKRIVTDRGTEFINRQVQAFFKENNISYYNPSGEHKAALAERANRSIEDIIFKYLSSRKTKKYIDVLQDIENTYNSRLHRTIQMSPNDAELKENQHLVRSAIFFSHRPIKVAKKPALLELGQRVRIKSYPTAFRRGYTPQATNEIFEIVNRLTHQPIPMYTLRSVDRGDVIEGNFYKHDLSLVE